MLLIENPEFGEMRGMWNQVLDSLLRRMSEAGQSSGSVTLKMNVVMAHIAVESAEGERMAAVPEFDYSVTSNMPQKYTYKGAVLMGEVEMQYSKENGISLRRLPNAQMTLDDYEDDDDGS